MGTTCGSLHLVYSSNSKPGPSLPRNERDRMTKKDKEMIKKRVYLSSEKIMPCGFEWRCNMVVLSAGNSAKGYDSNINIEFFALMTSIRNAIVLKPF